MRTIYKYPLKIEDEQVVQMPRGAVMRKVAIDPLGQLCIWAEIDTEEQLAAYTIAIFGTGHPIPKGDRWAYWHIETVVLEIFVWHVYLRVEAITSRELLQCKMGETP